MLEWLLDNKARMNDAVLDFGALCGSLGKLSFVSFTSNVLEMGATQPGENSSTGKSDSRELLFCLSLPLYGTEGDQRYWFHPSPACSVDITKREMGVKKEALQDIVQRFNKKACGDLILQLGFEPAGKPVRALTLKPTSYVNEITDVTEKEVTQESQTLLSVLFEESAATFIRAKKGHNEK